MDILGQLGGAYIEFGKFLGENFTGVYDTCLPTRLEKFQRKAR
jgi:hypothetical protein